MSAARQVLSDRKWVSAVATIPSARDQHVSADLASIQRARTKLPGDEWLASRCDESLLPFCGGTGNLTERLMEESLWRQQWVPPASDSEWEFPNFFRSAAPDSFYPGEKPFLEWVCHSNGQPVQLDGSSVVILRPYRHRIGAIDAGSWLRLIAWHGERATSTWASGSTGDGRGCVSLIIDRTGASLRNQDPFLLKELLPPLARHYPHALHKAYVSPTNGIFWAIWVVVRALLPASVTARFQLFTGENSRAALLQALPADVAQEVERCLL